MKIHSLTKLIEYFPLVRRADGEHSSGGQSQSGGERGFEGSEQETQEESAEKFQNVDQAVEAFQTDVTAHVQGLNVSIEGKGPGLKVVLKDPAGSVVRSFSGEEFLRFREKSTKDGRVVGKILDTKL